MNWKIFVIGFIVYGFMFTCINAQETNNNNNNCSRQDNSLTPATKCSRFGNWEYMYFTHEHVVYAVAEERCSERNGTLVIIPNGAIQEHIVQNLPKICPRSFFYIGLFRRPNGDFFWPDGSPLNYQNWRILHGGERCDNEPNGYRNCDVQSGPADATQLTGCSSPRFETGDWFDKNQFTSEWFYICQRKHQEPQEIRVPITTTEALTTTPKPTTEALTTTPEPTTEALTTTPEPTTEALTTTPEPTTEALTTTPEPTAEALTTTPKPITTKSKTRIIATTAETTDITTSEITSAPTKATTATTTTTTTAATTTSTTTTTATTTTLTTTTTTTPRTTIAFTPKAMSSRTPSTAAMVQTADSLGGASLRNCLAQLLQNVTLGMDHGCDLDALFGNKFSIADWENRISVLLGDILLRNSNVPKSITLHQFPGITIVLRRLESQEDARRSESIQFQSYSQNSFNLNFHTLNNQFLASVNGKTAIVAASIENSLWFASNLSSTTPAGPIRREVDENRLDASDIIHFLPFDQNVLSFSLFALTTETNQALDTAVKKLSVPIQTTFNFDVTLDEIDDIYSLDSSSPQSRIARNGIVYECAFLDASATKWSKSGCQFESGSDGIMNCNCDHTTTFGVLLAVRTFTIPKSVTILITSLELLSVLALLITIVLLTWLRKSMHNDRTIVQINLAGSLLLLHLFIVISDYVADRTQSGFCQSFAVFIQFFTLTTVFWMLNEGIVLYFKTYKNALSFNLRKIFPLLAAVAWGFPLLYVTICASTGLTLGKYLDKITSCKQFPNITMNASDPVFATCYVGFDHGMIYSVVVPLVLVFLITATIVVKTSVKINAMTAELAKMRPSGKTNNHCGPKEKSSKGKAQYNEMNARRKMLRQASNTLRALVLLLPVLGITWFLGFLVNIPGAEVYFVVIFGVINGLQGVFIFYIYCIKNSHFRRVFNRKWKEMSTNLIGTDIYHSSNNNRMSLAASQQSSHSRF